MITIEICTTKFFFIQLLTYLENYDLIIKKKYITFYLIFFFLLLNFYAL